MRMQTKRNISKMQNSKFHVRNYTTTVGQERLFYGLQSVPLVKKHATYMLRQTTVT